VFIGVHQWFALRLRISISTHHRQPCDPSAGPCGLEIESAGDAIDIEALAREVQAGDDATLHPAEINFLQSNPATGDEFVFVGCFAFDLKSTIRELIYQYVFTIFGELRPLGFWCNGCGFE
jgi:hypothetical protein